MLPEQTKAPGLSAHSASLSLAMPNLSDVFSGKAHFKSRSRDGLVKSAAVDVKLSPAMTALAATPPPPAGAVALAAVGVERRVAPVLAKRPLASQPDPELPAFSFAMRLAGPGDGIGAKIWKRLPVAAPVERIAVARAFTDCLLAPLGDLELPAFTVALRLPAPASGPAHLEWKRLPAPEPAERLVSTHGAALVAFPSISARQPSADCLLMADPASTIVADSSRAIPLPQTGEPALSAAGPLSNVAISVPAAHQPEYCGYFPDGPEREAPVLPAALSARSLATPVSGRAPAAPPMRLPRIDADAVPNPGLPCAPFFNPSAPPAEETAMPSRIEQAPISTVTVRPPKSPEPVQFAALAMADLLPLEYFCSRGPRVHPHGVGWIIPSLAATAPRFTVPLMIERVEPVPAAPPVRRKKPAFAEIFTLPEAAAQRPAKKWRDVSIKIAACFLAASLLYYGASLLRTGGDSAGRTLVAEDSIALHANPVASRESHGFFGRIRSAISGRAEVHLNDGFDSGMPAWGATAKSLAPGWARHSEGYVTPGKLALYRPTLRYTDYRLEFFGQIESKSLDWAVRATDDSNYYAMKFAADGPGPRAVVSMVHYPVVAGQKGQRVVTPLSIMIHEHTPYHVEVDVTGDRVTTSIEGEQVDSFVDSTLARGGVGFFSDAGEQARLYWIKVSRNEDWLGRVCAFLSGGGSARAQLLPPAGTLPTPDSGDPVSTNHLVLAAGFGFLRRNPFSRISDHRRFSPWRS
jgi:hypothetical protein